MKKFIKNEVYYFDEIYRHCGFAVSADYNCNNGYICGHEECSEACENNPKLRKCFSWSCPLVADGADIETVKKSSNFIVEELSFNEEGFTEDYEEVVVWIGENNE